jgi:hypothetical protein
LKILTCDLRISSAGRSFSRLRVVTRRGGFECQGWVGGSS